MALSLPMYFQVHYLFHHISISLLVNIAKSSPHRRIFEPAKKKVSFQHGEARVMLSHSGSLIYSLEFQLDYLCRAWRPLAGCIEPVYLDDACSGYSFVCPGTHRGCCRQQQRS